MLALLFILGVLSPLYYAELQIDFLDSAKDGVLVNPFPNALLLKQPNCTAYANQLAELQYMDLSSGENRTMNFTVCSDNPNWFLLNNLKNNTLYTLFYKIGNIKSNEITTNTSAFQKIDDGLQARSGAMVVITVILSLAMVILLAGLILTLFFFSG